jgi:hypothetical protein
MVGLPFAWGGMRSVASSFILEGAMIPRNEHRRIDERNEPRAPASSGTGVLEFRGRKHVVQLINVSKSGAMVIFAHSPNIGERLPLQLLDHGFVQAQVRWVRNGRIGLSFAPSRE